MRNRSLDGLRGFAIAVVILYHHSYLNAGWLGVDLFFVLSGYLITNIIRQIRAETHFWSRFWIKRLTRILPPLVLLLAMTSLLGFDLSLAQTAAYLLTLGDVLALTRPHCEVLRPLWSLAVEEHFYMLWPVAVRFMPRRLLAWMLIAIVAIEPLARSVAIVATRDWQVVYFLTPFRLEGLSLGCLLAIGFESPRIYRVAAARSGIALACTIALWFAFRIVFGRDFTRENSTVVYSALCYLLVACAALFLMAHILTHGEGIVARAFRWKPLVFLGTISYGLYLYHVLILELLRREFSLGPRQALWFGVPISLFVSWISYTFYERPIVLWGKRRAESFRYRVAVVSTNA